MTTSFFLRSIDSDLSVGGALFNRKLLEDTATAASQVVNTAANETVDAYAFTEPDVPGPDGSAGDYTVSIHITSGATQIEVSARLARVNSSGAVQSEGGFSTPDAGNAGVKVHEFESFDLGTWQAGDRLRVQYRFVNTDSMMARSLTIELNTVETELITPWAGDAEPVTGTLAVTEDSDSLSSSGTVTDPPVTGSLSVTEQGDVLAASGTAAAPEFVGTLDVTEDGDTVTASGDVTGPTFTGTLDATDQNDTLAASGTVEAEGITGSLAVTEDGDVLTAAGTHTGPVVTGTLDATEASDSLAASGTAASSTIAGSLDVTEQGDTLTATGSHAAPTFTGTVGVQEESDALTSAGETTAPPVTGTVAATEAADTLTASGTATSLVDPALVVWLPAYTTALPGLAVTTVYDLTTTTAVPTAAVTTVLPPLDVTTDVN